MADIEDVVIIGGGPVGAALALALTRSGRMVTVVEPRAGHDGVEPLRPVALSYGSRLILERLDAWSQAVPATPITRIHVSQRGGFGRAMLTARAAGLPALGYVVDYSALRTALAARLVRGPQVRVIRASVLRIVPGHEHAAIEYSSGQSPKRITARIVAVADGGAVREDSAYHSVDYGQTAVVAMVSSERPHASTAFERFTTTGPLALLPYDERYALVWSMAPERAQELCGLGADGFAIELEREFGGRVGAFHGAEQRAAFPLMLRVSADSDSPRVVRVGNAAQTLHPVAGQGLNLGLRDAWELADELLRPAAGQIGGGAACAAFRARRRFDRAGVIGLTDALVRGFSNELTPLRLVRGAALTGLGCLPPARDFLVRRMAFGLRG